MKKLLIGLFASLALGGGIAYAETWLVFYDTSEELAYISPTSVEDGTFFSIRVSTGNEIAKLSSKAATMGYENIVYSSPTVTCVEYNTQVVVSTTSPSEFQEK